MKKEIFKREISGKLREYVKSFPVVFLTGPRQSGKSTLLQALFKEYKYINLEDIAIREQAKNDPKGFLEFHGHKLIIDEAQNVPELFSYIQIEVDKIDRNGLYILSGSQNFLMMQTISQSLAGRVGVLELLPFSKNEVISAKVKISVNEIMFNGGYPRLLSSPIKTNDFYNSYIKTYVERDVRTIVNISNVSLFINFLRVLANRAGRIIDISDIANVCGISRQTVESWMSILETSYICFRLQPYFRNFDKRIRKMPKLYFYDTGLLCALLKIRSYDELSFHSMRGEIFENCVILEKMKEKLNQALPADIYYWRESNNHEVDLIFESGSELIAVEIKSSVTPHLNHCDNLIYFGKIADLERKNMHVVFAGSEEAQFNSIRYIPFTKYLRD